MEKLNSEINLEEIKYRDVSSEEYLEDISYEELVSDNITKRDHILLSVIGFIPFLMSVAWYVVYTS